MCVTASVLVLEDQAVIRSLVKRLLSHRGYVVVEAPDLAAASAALNDGKVFDLVIADSNLPDGDGVVFARQAQHLGQVRHVIVTSGEPIDARWPGLDAVLPKPFSADTLVKTVQTALAE